MKHCKILIIAVSPGPIETPIFSSVTQVEEIVQPGEDEQLERRTTGEDGES